MFYLTDEKDETFDPRLPFPVDTTGAQKTSSVSSTVTYNGKAAAGAISINSLEYRNVFNPAGDRIGSYWGNPDNLVYSTHNPETGVLIKNRNFVSLTETDGSAAVVINDLDNNLENMFESLTTTVKRFILKATDTSGNVLYGWIFGVAASGYVYTIDVVNNRLTETQNWVGTTASFDNTSVQKIEIFKYESSLSFGTGTTFTEEVQFPQEYTKSWKATLEYAENLSNGQYFVDYMRGLLVGKRADTTASETVTYNVEADSIVATGTFAVDTELAAAAAITDNFANPTTAPLMGMNMLWDGSAWDRALGDSTNGARVYLNNLELAEDSVHTTADKGIQPLAVRNDTLATLCDTDGDYTPLQVDANGALYVNVGGAAITVEGSIADDSAFTPGTSKILMTGATFDDTTPDSVDEGDAGALRMSANRNLYSTIRDAAGNERGANVTASNELSVLDSNSANALTALQLIDDTVATLGTSTYAEATTKGNIMGAVRNDTLASLVDTDNEIAPLQVNANGALYVDMVDTTIAIDEFPDAAAITDNFANPTTTNIMAMGMAWDGSAWDRVKGDSTDGLLVNLGTNNDVTVTGTVTANAGTNLNTSSLALESGGNLATVAGDTTAIDTTLGAKTDNKSTATDTTAVSAISLLKEISYMEQTPASRVVTATDLDIRDLSNTTDSVLMYANTAKDGSGTDYVPLVDADGNLQVDVLSCASHAVTNAGTFAVQPGSALTGDGNPTIDSLSQVAINLTTGADQVLVSSAANKQIWVYGVTFTCGDEDGQTVSFQDEDDNAISGVMEFAQYGGMAHSPSGNFAMPLWKLGTDKDLEVDITGGDVDGFLTYAIVSV